jgi:hypothetical protein
MLNLSRRVLQILMILNIVAILAAAAMLVGSIAASDFVAQGLAEQYAPDQAAKLIVLFRWIMVLTVVTGVAAHILLGRMLALVAAAIAGDPFTLVNAERLRVVAWALLAIQIMDIAFGIVASMEDAQTSAILGGWSPSLSGWIAVLMLFVLARVFEQGSRMRDELAMTV